MVKQHGLTPHPPSSYDLNQLKCMCKFIYENWPYEGPIIMSQYDAGANDEVPGADTGFQERGFKLNSGEGVQRGVLNHTFTCIA